MKKRWNAGFTLAETLITVALLGIIFLALGGGFVALQKAYRNITEKANAQVLMSTAEMEITNDLRNTTIYYQSEQAFETSSRGYAIQYLNDVGNGIQVSPYKADASQGLVPAALVTKQTNTESLYTYFDPLSFSYDSTGNYFTYTLSVYRKEDATAPIETQKVKVKAISAVTVK